MNDTSPQVTDHSDSQSEQSQLDRVLRDSDSLLANSLRDEERRLRRRRIVLCLLFFGGIVMVAAFAAVMSGWLTLAAPPPMGEEKPTAENLAAREEWVQRLTGLRDHMHTAFGVGPDLTLLDPKEGLAIVEEAWPKIDRFEVKTGLLKTFAFSKALPEKHPKLFRVLHLGMSDADPKVVEYAAAYLKEYSGEDFSEDPTGYEAWYKKFGGKTPAEVSSQGTGTTENSAALTQRGWALWKQQQFAEAIEPFEKAVELDPKNADAWKGLGWARFNSGNAEQAVEAFEKCVKLEPMNPAALNGLGQIHLMWREYDQAEKYLKKAAPTASAAWYGLARLYLLEGNYKEAQKWIRKSIAQQPGDEMLQQMLASAKAKNLDDSLRKQIEGPGRPKKSAGGNLAAEGWRNFNQGKPAEAEKTFREALKAEPENLAAMNGLGFVLVNSGKPKEAIAYFQKYLELEPDAPGPMNGLARCQYALDKVDEAIGTWEKMYEKHPGPNAAAVGLAQTFLEREEYAKAIPYFEVLVKSQPNNSQWSEGLEAAKEGAKEAESK